MDFRKLLVGSMLAAGAATLAPSSMARVDVGVVIAPPAPVIETVPAPRYGYSWAPGYWRWNGHHHVWRSGYWVHGYQGRHWVAHRWEHRGGRWYSHEGHWG
jgi:hypothetical protein